jgi:Kef-type K+ transport system membrane component KefB
MYTGASTAGLTIQVAPPGSGVGSGTPESFLAILGVLLFFGLLLPRLLKPLHLPLSTVLILVGALLGPNGTGFFQPDPGITLFGFLGATFHMLLAGTEAHSLDFRLRDPRTMRVLVPNALLPGMVGTGIGLSFGYGWQPSLFLGIVFLSSSIMLVFGMVSALRLGRSTTGRLIKRVSVIEDLAASILAFVLFQTLAPHPRFPLPILGGLLLSSVLILRMFLPELMAFAFEKLGEDEGTDPEARLRLVIALMLVVIFGYASFDVHPVIGAFLVGFALSTVPQAAALRNRLETLGYAFFIPIFFFVVGLDTDLTVLLGLGSGSAVALSILAGSVGSKLVGGLLGGLWAGLDRREAAFVGLASTVKLAVPLSATYAARELGILDAELFSAVVTTSVMTSIVAPLVLPLIAGRSLFGEDDT